MNDSLLYIVNHVFCPPKRPQQDDLNATGEHELCQAVHQYAGKYQTFLPPDQKPRWDPITRMLENLRDTQELSALSKEQIKRSIAIMHPGDILSLLIRAQNAGVILRKFVNKTVFETFEASPPAAEVLATNGKLVYSYPGLAIAVSSDIVNDPIFLEELSSFLVQMDVDVLKVTSSVTTNSNSAYITQLLTGILRGIGQLVETCRIQKRIGDDVLCNASVKPWRRSPLWLVIRVALQTSLFQESHGHSEYKTFMIFLMARILGLVVLQKLSSDLVFCMRGKISRRLYKLGSAPTFVLQAVRDAVGAAEEMLQERWSMIQKQQAISARWTPRDLDIVADTRLSLRHSKQYISQILERKFLPIPSNSYKPTHTPRLRRFPVNEYDLSRAFAADPAVALADFEFAVENDLKNWVTNHLHAESACVIVATCITQYSAAALKLYASNPEDQSLMLLTVFSLWVALDKLAMVQCPLLQEYSPEIPLEILEPLLLRSSQSFHRLTSIEDYLRGRHHKAFPGRSIFTDQVNQDTFSVRYFKTSKKHQSLLSRIETNATSERQKKMQELWSKNVTYQNLVVTSRDLDHEVQTDEQGDPSHSVDCRKCSLEQQARRLYITVHEWPLPQDSFKAQVAVFELACPIVFNVWRTTVYYLLRDVCRSKRDISPSVDPPPHSYLLEKYKGLQAYLAHDQLSRITLISTTASSWNDTVKIPSVQKSVCIDNHLQFRLFDKVGKILVADPFTDSNVVSHCALQLPDGPYKSLQYAVDGTSHTSNEIMANQSECHVDLNLHEYIAFATLRSGHRLQWLNIARELSAKSLRFHREEVNILLTQAAWQIGPLSRDGEREWHADLSNADFGLHLLKELEDLTISIEGSWLESATMKTIITLASRLLTSTSDDHVKNNAYSLLRRARDVSFAWVHQLASKLQEREDENEVREFQLRVCEMAAICRGTYDVDLVHAPFLLNSSGDIAVLVECAVLVYDNAHAYLDDLSPGLKRLLDRDRRLSHSLEPILRQQIRTHPEGLDLTVATIWPAYHPGPAGWQQLGPLDGRWFVATTATRPGQRRQNVQLNLLDGRLLISGKELARLPESIVNHKTYTRILGQKVLDVIPSDMPDMDFGTRGLVSDYQVFFALRGGGAELVIRTRRGSQILELVPHDKLTGDLPTLLVQNYAHWLDLSNGEIELRPLENPWRSGSGNQRLHFSHNGHSKLHTVTSHLLVDIRSPTFQMISACLKPLEPAEYITVSCSSDGASLSVDLPRLRLSFFLNSEQLLECQNMPGMVIDQDQSTGTMFGLTSQLVLRAKDASVATQLPQPRRVIVPYSKQVHIEPRDNHVNIVIDTTHLSSVNYYEYKIDNDLGCLAGSVSLTSQLYKVYLHALSSHCLPDLLTGHTGTEEALHELRSARCHSFQQLSTVEADLLLQIASLTPVRTMSEDKDSECVKWSDITPIAQHHGFVLITQSILNYAERLRIFHGQSSSTHHVPSHLIERAGRRISMFYPPEFAGPLPSGNGDVERAFSDGESIEVCHISAMVYHWPSKLNTTRDLFAELTQWQQLSAQSDGLTLSYNRDWLHLDLPKTWISLYNLCRMASREQNRFQLIFSLSAMAYGSPESRCLIPTLLAFATIPYFRTLDPPSWTSYNLSQGCELQEHMLRKSISPSQSQKKSPGMPVSKLFDILINQWPCKEPNWPPSLSDKQLMSRVETLFLNWFQNSQLRDHIKLVQAALDEARGPDRLDAWGGETLSDAQVTPLSNARARPSFRSWFQKIRFRGCFQNIDHIERIQTPAAAVSKQECRSIITFDQLFDRTAPKTLHPPTILGTPETYRNRSAAHTADLSILLSEFQGQRNTFYGLYGNDLGQSLRSLDSQTVPIFPARIPYTMAELTEYRDKCKKHLQDIYASIHQSLSPSESNPVEVILHRSGLWPRITTRSLLGKLASGSARILNRHWKRVLTSFAQGILWFQRSRRLCRWASLQNCEEFFKELVHGEHGNRDALENLDWLLIQVDSDFLIRPIQTRIAQEMVTPTSEQNTVIQLNMGEGKTSVIVPIVAATLAHGKQLVRVIVLKSLSTQMFQLLVGRLSGLANRRIFYMPFSRMSKVDASQAKLIRDLYEECMREGGILVVQPEHILSFKLMGIERLLFSTSVDDREVAHSLLQSQKWLEVSSRDILDESDEILRVQYQLIYTVGQHQPLDADRWISVQQVLSLVKKHVSNVQHRFPLGVESVQESPDYGSFPPLRLLQVEASELLVASLAKDALDGALHNCSFRFPGRICQAAMRMVTEINATEEDARLTKQFCEANGSWKCLLQLRGLFAHGVLVHALKEMRWRVNYGLDPGRSLLAVPYRAKDVPALSAEFGHPDVAIVLTCLSYYYGGLSDGQLDLCFKLLYKLDNPTMEYENWIRNNDSVPKNLHQLSGVNTRDPDQRRKVLPRLFQRNKAVIDFFLSQVVFPKEAREFPQKLTTSAWDIAEIKECITTGFSGTNDNRYLLPLSIIQHDLPEQLSTNARVLGYVLGSENDHYTCFQNQNGERLSASSFIRLIVEQTPEIRILLDVGAQMLELRATELAKEWMSLKPEVPGVIFFGDNDELVVMTQDYIVESLISSPFHQHLDRCLVYLDDAHTRGTDLKLPQNSRAAVTLGPKVTKDRLLQGCMRMRKLGHGQSVIFFAPPDVDRSIRVAAKKSPLEKVKVQDILRWAMLETCADIQHHIPHWAQQGVDYQNRKKSWFESSRAWENSHTLSTDRLKSSWLRPEARTLEMLYGHPSSVKGDTADSRPHLVAVDNFSEIRQRCEMLGVSCFVDTRIEEEQEREVSHEVEVEYRVERPSKAEAAMHQVHNHIHNFIRTGIVPSTSSEFVPVFFPLYKTAAAPRRLRVWSQDLLATKDFSTTIQNPSQAGCAPGDYLRPVNWIISSVAQGRIVLVVFSPHEVNELLPEIRKSRTVHLHQYVPRVRRGMKPLDDLKFYCIPALPSSWSPPPIELQSRLNLWAGQLFLQDYPTYLQLCGFLGVDKKTLDVIPSTSEGSSQGTTTDSSLPFLKELTRLRRKGMGYSLTHMGKIVNAKLLTEVDFDVVRAV